MNNKPNDAAQVKLAYKVFAKAMKRGALKKPSNCSRCGVSGVLDGHHADYAKPLEVEWLCRTCHQDAHHRIKKSVRDWSAWIAAWPKGT